MSSYGKIQVHAFTSNAQIPLQDAAVIITNPDRTALSMQLTNRSGFIDEVVISVPDIFESMSPGAEVPPYTFVNLYAWKKGYEPIIAENLQVFPETTTIQDLEMIPVSESPDFAYEYQKYITSPQDL